MTNSEVISRYKAGPELNNPTQGRYAPLGPDLRYIGRLPGTHDNNFEEEYIFGEDKQSIRSYTVDGKGDPCYKEVIKYGEGLWDYYELEYYEYDMRPQRQDVTVDGDKLIINLHSRLENLPEEDGIILRKYSLQFYPRGGEKELVSTKAVVSKFQHDEKYFVEIVSHIEEVPQ